MSFEICLYSCHKTIVKAENYKILTQFDELFPKCQGIELDIKFCENLLSVSFNFSFQQGTVLQNCLLVLGADVCGGLDRFRSQDVCLDDEA